MLDVDVIHAQHENNTQEHKTLQPTCPAGTRVISGGFSFHRTEVHPMVSKPEGNGWRVEAVLPGGGPSWTMDAYAVCALLP